MVCLHAFVFLYSRIAVECCDHLVLYFGLYNVYYVRNSRIIFGYITRIHYLPAFTQASELRNQIKAASNVAKDADTLSDPSTAHWLPFPSLATIPKRFKRNQQRCFYYEGRHEMKKRVKEIKDNLAEGRHLLWHGTVGYGKSHLLAVVACHLLADDYHVVYIPDCSKLKSDNLVFHALRNALFVAFSDNMGILRQIDRQQDLKNLIDWCIRRECIHPSRDSKIVFLLDQAHPLIAGESHSSQCLNDIIDNCCAVRAISIRDQTIATELTKVRDDEDVSCFGGVTNVCV